MNIQCDHGYFKFYETQVGQVSEFMRITGLELSPVYDYFTFKDLAELEPYSLIGKLILNYPAIKTFSGSFGEMFEANQCIYDFSTGLILPIDLVISVVKINNAGNKFVTNGLIVPGSFTDRGEKIKGFSAWVLNSTTRVSYSRIDYV